MQVSLPQAEVEEGGQSKLGEVSSTGTGLVDGHSTISLPPTWNTYICISSVQTHLYCLELNRKTHFS